MDLKAEAETLRRVPMFSRMEASKLKLLAFTSELLTFEDKEILFSQGEISDSAYVVMYGDMEIVTGELGTDTEVVAAVLRQNELVGEMGVITKAPRSATIRARGEVRALRIDGDMFLDLITDNPSVALDVLRQLSEKVARTHRLYEEAQVRIHDLLSEPGQDA